MRGSATRPTHLWIVGVLAALWNGFGTYDYTMTQIRNPAWMEQFSEAQLAFQENAPALADASWAFGVWGGLAGSLLLLARSRHAVPAFILSLGGLLVNSVWQFTLPEPSPHLDTSGGLALHAAIWAIAIGLLVYALRMRARGVLG